MFNGREEVLEFVKKDGPVLPIQVAKKLNTNTMFSGAILSELIANKLIKVSYAKIGGSPIYYVDGQEERLFVLYDYLPGKEKEAYTLLKNNKILIDELQEPSIRFALSQIKDFSFSFNVEIEDKEIKCWRWHLIKEDEAINLINALFKKEEPKKEKIIEIPVQQVLEKPDLEIKKEILEVKEKSKKTKEDKGRFFNSVHEYLINNKVKILENETIRKGKEFDFVAHINSHFGELPYLIKATDKKVINDKDVIMAFNKGNLKKLPVILLSKGKLSKKAEKYIKENLNGYLVFKGL